MKIVCLSLTQPWSTLMAIGAKRVETRSWSTSYRGWVAIHASKGFPKWARELATWDERFVNALADAGFVAHKLPLGAIVAVGKVVSCGCTDILVNTLSEREQAFGDYSRGRYGWLFEEIHQLPAPIPASGMLGLWTPEDDVLARLEEFIREVQS